MKKELSKKEFNDIKLLEEYFEEEVEMTWLHEYKILGIIFQVMPCEEIENCEEFAWLATAEGTIKYKEHYFIPQ